MADNIVPLPGAAKQAPPKPATGRRGRYPRGVVPIRKGAYNRLMRKAASCLPEQVNQAASREDAGRFDDGDVNPHREAMKTAPIYSATSLNALTAEERLQLLQHRLCELTLLAITIKSDLEHRRERE